MLISLHKISYWSNKNEIVRTLWEQIRKLSLNSREGTGEAAGTHKTAYDYAVSIYRDLMKKASE